MRLLLLILLLSTLCQPVYAEEPPTQDAPAIPSALAQSPVPPPVPQVPPGSATPAAPAVASLPVHHSRMTWQNRFAHANAAHDGHLTLAEAKSSYRTIARHFRDIDVDGKGYVTEDDVRAWHAFQRASRTHVKAPDDALRPRNAFQQQVLPRQQLFRTSASRIVALPADRQKPAVAPDTAAILDKE